MEKQRRVKPHTRVVNGKEVPVRSHTRSAQWARSRSAWIGAGFSTLTATAILWEAGVTLVATLSVVLIAALTAVAVVAGAYAEKNKKTMRGQRTRRTTQTRRTTGARPRTSSSRARRPR